MTKDDTLLYWLGLTVVLAVAIAGSIIVITGIVMDIVKFINRIKEKRKK